MKFLDFESVAALHGNRRIKRATFSERSLYPVSAACVIANGVREVLSHAFGAAADVRLLEPVIPTQPAWAHILRDAHVFAVKGPLTNAALILRQADARALVGVAFGESALDSKKWSSIEREVLARIVSALATTLAPAVGQSAQPLRATRVAKPSEYCTFVEIVVEQPVRARLGVGLAREPDSVASATLTLRDLGDVPMTLRARLPARPMTAAEVLRLQLGTVVPMSGETGTLLAEVFPFRTGVCGVSNAAYALNLR